MSYHVFSCCFMSCHVISSHFMSRMGCRVISCHLILNPSLCDRSSKRRVQRPEKDAEEACRQVFGDRAVDDIIEEKKDEFPDGVTSGNDDDDDDGDGDINRVEEVPHLHERLKTNPFDLTDAEEDYYRRCFRACDANNSGM